MIRFAEASMRNCWPGGMTVVALYSVMMAGPEYFLPGRRLSREWMLVSFFLPSNMTGALGGESLPSLARLGRPRTAVSTWFIFFAWLLVVFRGGGFVFARGGGGS